MNEDTKDDTEDANGYLQYQVERFLRQVSGLAFLYIIVLQANLRI